MMKHLIYVSLFVLLVSCSQEKSIQKTQTKDIFEKESTGSDNTVSGITVSEEGQSSGTSSRFSSNSLFINELKNNSIPHYLPNENFADWKSFRDFYYSKKPGLSSQTNQYCSELLLKSFDLTKYTASNAEVKTTIIDNVSFLVQNKYKGYGLLHQYLSWLKTNNLTEFTSLKEAVLVYAKPILPPPNPELKNDPRVESNPEFKAKMDKLIADAKNNDAFIQKIKSL
jgi:hypothetical protein